MSERTSIVTPVARPTGVSWYVSFTSLATSPSTPPSTATLITPSSPVNTWVFGISPSPLLEVHGHADEVDGERRLQRHHDGCDAPDLLRPARGDVELVRREHLVDDHLRQEAVERRLERGADADVVQLPDVRVRAEPDAGLRVVDDPPHADLAERAGVGRDAAHDLEAEAAPHRH